MHSVFSNGEEKVQSIENRTAILNSHRSIDFQQVDFSFMYGTYPEKHPFTARILVILQWFDVFLKEKRLENCLCLTYILLSRRIQST